MQCRLCPASPHRSQPASELNLRAKGISHRVPRRGPKVQKKTGAGSAGVRCLVWPVAPSCFLLESLSLSSQNDSCSAKEPTEIISRNDNFVIHLPCPLAAVIV